MPDINQTERILVLTEDTDLLDFLEKQVLLPAGYEVQTAQTGVSALQLIQDTPPDLLVTDWSLDGLSGRDLLVALRAQGMLMPVIMLLDSEQSDSTGISARLGASDTLCKPLREAEVVASVDRVLQSTHLQYQKDILEARFQSVTAQQVHQSALVASILQAIQVLTRWNSWDSMAPPLLEIGRQILHADIGWLTMIHPRDHSLWLRATCGWESEMNGKRWESGIEKMVLWTGKPLRSTSTNFAHLPVASLAQAVLAIPIQVADRATGVVVWGRKTLIPFTPTDLPHAQALADCISIGIRLLTE